jgi:hypothetical protein
VRVSHGTESARTWRGDGTGTARSSDVTRLTACGREWIALWRWSAHISHALAHGMLVTVIGAYQSCVGRMAVRVRVARLLSTNDNARDASCIARDLCSLIVQYVAHVACIVTRRA